MQAHEKKHTKSFIIGTYPCNTIQMLGVSKTRKDMLQNIKNKTKSFFFFKGGVVTLQVIWKLICQADSCYILMREERVKVQDEDKLV